MKVENRRMFFIAAVVLQLVILLFIAVPRALTLSTGKMVTFETEPFDPWDLFRGDYVRMRFDFSSVPSNVEFLRTEKVFVVLRKGKNDRWSAKSISIAKPNIAPDEIVLRGRVDYRMDKNINVKYGIEEVLVSEGAGKDLKAKDRLQMDVVVDNDGNAVIKELRQNDNKLFKWRWF